MKLSLILQAIDRWSAPTKAVTRATADLGNRGLKPLARESGEAKRELSGLMAVVARQSGLARMGAVARRVAQHDLAILKQGFDRARTAGNSLFDRAALWTAGKLGAGLRYGVVGGAAAAGAAGGLFARGVIGNAAKFEQYAVALETTERSATKAQAAMAWVQQFAKETPYDIDTVTEAFVRARGVGIDPLTGAFRTLGDTAGSTNKTLMDAIEMMADAQTGEFERLKEFGVTSASKGSSVTFSYLDKNGKAAARSVRKSANEIRSALLDIFDSKYAGGMARQAKTLTGIWSNLGDVVTDFELRVAKRGIFDRVKSRLQEVLDWTDRLKKEGRLDDWAQEVSDRFIELFDRADHFVRDVDWRSVADGVGGITSAVVTLVEWIGKASAAWNKLKGLGDAIDQRTGFDNGSNSLESKVWSVLSWDPFDGWAANRVNGSAGAPPARRRTPPVASGSRRDRWPRAVGASGSGPAPTPKDGRVAVDIRLSGEAAPRANVRSLQSTPGVDASVSRGRGPRMAGPA